ncbi:MAG: hypothetical protein LRY73_17740 [Bacillus sp. (in: Bacteria)]|nr:hypothetical protein [Bacillus sp. (in: firmicutes)]
MQRLVESYLKKKLSMEKIEATFQNSQDASSEGAQSMPEQGAVFKVAAVQRDIQLVRNVESFAKRMKAYVADAANGGCQLIAFPEYNFFDLVGVIPGVRSLNQFFNNKAKKVTAENVEVNGNAGTNKQFATIFQLIADPTREALLTIMKKLAVKYGIYIYTGTYLLKEGNHLYNAGSLIDRSGAIIATQKKLHLTDFEDGLGLQRDDTLQVVELDFGIKVAFPICMDATYFETFLLAKNEGADFIILPIANMEEYTRWKALRGIWPRVQESYLFGVKPSLNGWLMGMHFTGKGGVFAPIEYTDNYDGIVALAEHYEGEVLLTAELDVDKLRRVKADAEYTGDSNLIFERDYVGKTYGREW